MIGGKYINSLSKEEILKRLSEKELWKFYVKNFKTLGKKFCSELREDNSPSCAIYQSKYVLKYTDFKTKESYDIFSYLMVKYRLSFYEVLNMINNDFRLNINSFNTSSYPIKNTGEYIKKYIEEDNTKLNITVKVRKYTQEDLIYWYNNYYISYGTLCLFRVFPVEHYYIIRDFDVIKVVCKTPTYGYWAKNRGWKIYAPFEKDEYKWISDIKGSYYFGMDQLPNSGEVLFITKALKDIMVFYEQGFSAICPPSETYDVEEAVINILKRKFRRIIVNYDNDETGKTFSEKLCRKCNLENFTVSEKEKDISGFIKERGLNETSLLLKKFTNHTTIV